MVARPVRYGRRNFVKLIQGPRTLESAETVGAAHAPHGPPAVWELGYNLVSGIWGTARIHLNYDNCLHGEVPVKLPFFFHKKKATVSSIYRSIHTLLTSYRYAGYRTKWTVSSTSSVAPPRHPM